MIKCEGLKDMNTYITKEGIFLLLSEIEHSWEGIQYVGR